MGLSYMCLNRFLDSLGLCYSTIVDIPSFLIVLFQFHSFPGTLTMWNFGTFVIVLKFPDYGSLLLLFFFSICYVPLAQIGWIC